jgi:replicative DNA helicase
LQGKEIPHSLEAESCLLGSMVMDNSILPKVLAKVSAESFYIEAYRLLFEGIKQTFEQKRAVDLVLIKDTMKAEALTLAGGPAKLMQIVNDLPNAANWEAYLRTIIEKEELRRYLRLSESVSQQVYAGSSAISIRDTLRQATIGRVANERSANLGLAGESVILGLAGQRASGVDLATGLHEIDELMGGLRRKEMTVVGGKMSNAKTSVAMNVTCNLIGSSTPKRVLINAFENVDQVPMRIAAILTQTPLEWFVKPHACSPEQYAKVEASLRMLSEFKDRVVVMNSASLLDMRSECDSFHPDVIILDYLQKYGQRYCTGADGLYAHEIGRVASEAQDLAKEYNAHTLLFSQLARRMNGERNRPPEVPDLKESGDIENCADNILLLWWPWRDQPDSGKDPNDYYIYVAKNKLGPVDKRILRMDVRTLTISSYGGK